MLTLDAWQTPSYAVGYPSHIHVITGDDGDTTKELVRQLSSRVPSISVGQEIGTPSGIKGNVVYVTVGPTALETWVASDLLAPCLSLFTSSEVYLHLKGTIKAARRSGLLTAVYAETSPVHQLSLIKELYRRQIAVAVLLSANTQHLQPLIEQGARASDVEAVIRLVEPGDNVLRVLAGIRDAPVLLAVPDHSIYSHDTIRYILESSYRRAQGVIGFTPSLVRAGMLAAAFASPDDVIATAVSALGELAIGKIPQAQYPAAWRVQINERVANSLNIVISDAARTLGSAQ